MLRDWRRNESLDNLLTLSVRQPQCLGGCPQHYTHPGAGARVRWRSRSTVWDASHNVCCLLFLLSRTKGREPQTKGARRLGVSIQTNRPTPSQTGCEARATGFRKQRNWRQCRQRNFRKRVLGSCEGSTNGIGARLPPSQSSCAVWAPLPESWARAHRTKSRAGEGDDAEVGAARCASSSLQKGIE